MLFYVRVRCLARCVHINVCAGCGDGDGGCGCVCVYNGRLALLTLLTKITHETHDPPFTLDAFVVVVGLVARLFVPCLRYLCSAF